MTKKKVLGFLVVGFLIFFVLESPIDAANAFRDVFTFSLRLLADAARSLSAFMRALF
ncbi:MAG: hypothetical protein M3N52_10615 [Actinomycetota bacterium]|nr:hypothetical protein [Actinomycetota bacterium]